MSDENKVTTEKFYEAQRQTDIRISGIQNDVTSMRSVVDSIYRALHANNGEQGLMRRVDRLEDSPFAGDRGAEMAEKLIALDDSHIFEAGEAKARLRFWRIIQGAITFVIGLIGAIAGVVGAGMLRGG